MHFHFRMMVISFMATIHIFLLLNNTYFVTVGTPRYLNRSKEGVGTTDIDVHNTGDDDDTDSDPISSISNDNCITTNTNNDFIPLSTITTTVNNHAACDNKIDTHILSDTNTTTNTNKCYTHRDNFDPLQSNQPKIRIIGAIIDERDNENDIKD